MNNANDDQQRNNSSSSPSGAGDDHTSTSETYVFTGTGGPALLASMQNLVNRIISRDQHSQQRDSPSTTRESEPIDEDVELLVVDDVAESQTDATAPSGTTTTLPEPVTAPTASTGDAATQTSNESQDASNTGPQGRPVRPLPRPHSHFHAHTPIGVIDLFTFNMGTTPPPPPTGTASFTFNLGPEAFAGFEAMFLNHLRKEREPDLERAKTLLRGMQIVPEGLVRRLERAGGVPGGQGTEDQSAGCAVCWGPLLDGVEPGEWDTAAQKEEKGKRATAEIDGAEEKQDNEEEFAGRIVALPCAHVYHAECLLPWFARNTTCPTCRFDVDPESLTWNPQASFAPPETEMPFPTAGQGETPTPGPTGAFPHGLTREDIERANAAEAERFNRFMMTLFRGFAGGGQGGQPPRQEENQSSDAEGIRTTESAQQAPVETQLQNNVTSGQAPSLYSLPFPSSTPHTTEWHTTTPPNPTPTFGPAPPPPPPPRLHGLPTLFRLPPVPLFFIPTRSSGIHPAQQQAHPQQPGQQVPSQTHQSPLHPHPVGVSMSRQEPQAQTASQPQQHSQSQSPQQPNPQTQQSGFPPQFVAFPPIYPTFHLFPGGGTPPHPHTAPHPHPHDQHPHLTEQMRSFMGRTTTSWPESMNRPENRNEREHVNRPETRERRKWVSPDPVGRTLRERVEAKERELGLRCDDVVCLVAPSDEDPVPSDSLSDASKATLTKRIQLHGAYDARGRLCEHSFHSACLVASARIAGLDGHGQVYEDDGLKEVRRADGEVEMNKDGSEEDNEERELEISCPVCRADGTLSQQEWQEGVKTL